MHYYQGIQINALLTGSATMAQVITGVVTAAENNEALPGVNVVQKGALNGSVTNAKGEYACVSTVLRPLFLPFRPSVT